MGAPIQRPGPGARLDRKGAESLQVARRPIEVIREAGPGAWAGGAAAAALLFAYSSLLDLGTRYGFEKGVEYWLFRPTDNAPLIIIVFASWLLYRRWYRVRVLPPSTAPPAVIAVGVLLAIGFHAWAIYTRADDLKVVSLVLVLSSLVVARWGVPGLRALALPIFFLLLAVPIPAPLLLAVVFEMQIWTANFAGFLLYVLGLPALVSGDQIFRATQTFQVIEGCSGLRSVETLTMLTILLIDLFGRRGWHAIVLLVAAPLVAFWLNGFRVLTLILNPHSEIIAIHNLQGIAILLVGLLVVYGIDLLIERLRGPEHEAADAWTPPDTSGSRPYVPALAATALGVLALGTGVSTLVTPIWPDPVSTGYWLYDVVSSELGLWRSEKAEIDYEFRGSTRFREVVDSTFELNEGPVRVFIGTADLGQRGGSVLSPTTARPGSGWVVRESAPRSLEEAGLEVEERLLEKGKRRVLIHHWYMGDRGLFEETWRSLMALDRSPLRRPEPLYVVRLDTPLFGRGEADRAAAEARLERVRRALEPAFEAIERGGSPT